DPYWGKSERFLACVSDFFSKSSTRQKKIYKPILYVPMRDNEDKWSARQWKQSLGQNVDGLKGIVEGFMDGNVEVLHLQNEFVSVVYHLSIPEQSPVSIPVGFLSTNKILVAGIGKLLSGYVDGISSFEKSNDCGYLKSIT